jgi:hypothetical protein
MTNPALLLGVIALQSAILAHQQFLDKKCILTLWEEQLTGVKIKYYNGKTMAGFNWILAKWFGIDGMLLINSILPHVVIIANCAKIYIGL